MDETELKLTTPVLHTNGSDGETLRNGYRDAARAVRKALDVVCATAPNGRDYYVKTPDGTQTAVREHEARVAKLREVATELEALYGSVQDQLDERARIRAGR